MATGHFFYTSDDGGAPSLTNAAGDMIAILDWALDVAGGTYWEKVFSGTNKAVYRATTGNRFYLRIDDTNANYARATMYQTMSDVDTGTGQTPSGVSYPSYQCWPRNDDGAAIGWTIVGDSQFFCLLINGDDNSYNKIPCIFGDLPSLDSADSYNTYIAGYGGATHGAYSTGYNLLSHGGAASFMGGSTSYMGPSQSNVFKISSPDGLTDSVPCAAFSLFGAALNLAMSSHVWPLCNYGASPSMVYCPIFLLASPGATGSTPEDFSWKEGISSYIAARVPYIYMTPYSIGDGIGNGDTVVDGSSEFVAYGGNFSSGSAYSKCGTLFMVRTSNDEPDRA